MTRHSAVRERRNSDMLGPKEPLRFNGDFTGGCPTCRTGITTLIPSSWALRWIHGADAADYRDKTLMDLQQECQTPLTVNQDKTGSSSGKKTNVILWLKTDFFFTAICLVWVSSVGINKRKTFHPILPQGIIVPNLGVGALITIWWKS